MLSIINHLMGEDSINNCKRGMQITSAVFPVAALYCCLLEGCAVAGVSPWLTSPSDDIVRAANSALQCLTWRWMRSGAGLPRTERLWP